MRQKLPRRNVISNKSCTKTQEATDAQKTVTYDCKARTVDEGRFSDQPYSEFLHLEAIEEGQAANIETTKKKAERRSFGSVGIRLRNPKKDKKATIAPRSPARVEPKVTIKLIFDLSFRNDSTDLMMTLPNIISIATTSQSFFANERTFIQWITVGSLFTVVAGLVYSQAHLSGPHGGGRSLMIVGNCMIGCGLALVVYGTVVYYRRLYLMIHARPYGYADSVGPAVLSLFMIAILGLNIYVYSLSFPYPNVTLKEEAGVCVKRNLGLGKNALLSIFTFEPSGVAVVKREEMNLLIIVSFDYIVAIPAGLPADEIAINFPMQMLYQFPSGSEDLEGVTVIDNTIYVVSEGKKNRDGDHQSEIIALDWVSSGANKLEETRRWRVKSPNAEAIAFISDSAWFGSPSLVVAGDTLDIDPTLRLDLDAFILPFPVNGTSPSQVRLNNKFFMTELVDTTASAMQFFKGNLYILYGNSMVIRAFSAEAMVINEWKLPVGVPLYVSLLFSFDIALKRKALNAF